MEDKKKLRNRKFLRTNHKRKGTNNSKEEGKEKLMIKMEEEENDREQETFKNEP